jgi:hypothetical protein
MLPPSVTVLLDAKRHDATTPQLLGAHNLPDEVLVRLASLEDRVIVTENASDFAAVDTCTVLLVRKLWWPASSLHVKLPAALDRWAFVNPNPGPFVYWLPAELR